MAHVTILSYLIIRITMATNASQNFVLWARPDFTSVVKTHRSFERNFHGAMMYAHYELSAADLKKEAIKYFKSLDSQHPLLEDIVDMNENRFSTVGKYMYILNHKGELPDNIMDNLMAATITVIEEEKKKILAKKAADVTPKLSKMIDSADPIKMPTIQDRLKDKALEVSAEIEGWLDDLILDRSKTKTLEDFANLLKTYEIKHSHIPHIKTYFKKTSTEYADLMAGKDKDLLEGYSNLTKADIKKFNQFMIALFSACDMIKDKAKIERAPKEKKSVSTDKIVAKFKFKKEDTSLGIVSVLPVNAIGVKELWSFDTKTRKITRFIADELHGPISIKGSSVVGFDEQKSVSKTLRKPKEQLAEFKKLGKVQLRSYLDSIKAVEIKAKGLSNPNVILLKVH